MLWPQPAYIAAQQLRLRHASCISGTQSQFAPGYFLNRMKWSVMMPLSRVLTLALQFRRRDAFLSGKRFEVLEQQQQHDLAGEDARFPLAKSAQSPARHIPTPHDIGQTMIAGIRTRMMTDRRTTTKLPEPTLNVLSGSKVGQQELERLCCFTARLPLNNCPSITAADVHNSRNDIR